LHDRYGSYENVIYPGGYPFVTLIKKEDALKSLVKRAGNASGKHRNLHAVRKDIQAEMTCRGFYDNQ
jgi:hypothetical protein